MSNDHMGKLLRNKISMFKERIYFRGFLANTDSSILKINLDHGFKIEAMTVNEGIGFISTLQNRTYMEVYEKSLNIINNSEDKCFFISNSFECDLGKNDKERRDHLINERTKFDETLVQGYLTPIIRFMKLFKEGNVYMPLEFWFFIDNNVPRLFTGISIGNNYNSLEIFTLEDFEISELQSFIQNIKLPFKEPFLQLAFETFELSYLTPVTNFTFLSLMICMEILLNPHDDQISHRISKNAAVLLGKNFEGSEKIFTDIKKLYKKRSIIIHGDTPKKSEAINVGDVVKLRNYVRDSIKEINKIGKNRNDILEFLNSQGYGRDRH